MPSPKSLTDLVVELREVLVSEEAVEYLPGVNALGWHIQEGDRKGALSIWRTMNGGAGTFTDLVLWRESRDEMTRVNQRLASLKNAISEALSA